jgi:hypothetical protein
MELTLSLSGVPDAVVVFHGHEFPICSRIFGALSTRYAQLLRTWRDPPSIPIESQVSDDSVASFINACQLKPFTLTADTVNEVGLLCDEWGVPDLRRSVD